MALITVYRFEMYDVQSDQMQRSGRWGTLEAIAKIGGQALFGTEVQIDESHVGGEVVGMTKRGFNPHSQISGGFQPQVTRGY